MNYFNAQINSLVIINVLKKLEIISDAVFDGNINLITDSEQNHASHLSLMGKLMQNISFVNHYFVNTVMYLR